MGELLNQALKQLGLGEGIGLADLREEEGVLLE